MSITYRSQKGAQLTSQEVDDNFEYLAQQVGLSGLTTPGVYSLIGTELKLFAETWGWSVFGEAVTNIADYTYNVPSVTAGNRRVDVVCGNSTGGILVLSGPAGSVEIDPVIPVNYARLLKLRVSSEGINVTSLLGNYISKASEGWTNVIVTAPPGENSYWYISENSRKLNITGSPNNAVFAGFHASGGSVSQLWDGCSLHIKNSRNVPQLLRHDAAGAAVKLWFFTGQDYWLPPNCVAFFLFNSVSMRYECVQVMSADMIYFDDSETLLGYNDVQNILKSIVRRGILKLEENLVFEVGYDKQFTSISSAIDKALEYYPNEIFTVTILIDEGFVIEEKLSYVNTDFSHIILSTTGEVTVGASLTGLLFRFENCWLPIIRDFEITGNYVMAQFIFAIKCFAYSDSNLKVKGFLTSLAISSSFSCRSDNSEITVPALNSTYGYNIQNSYFRIANTKIISENTSALSITTYAVFGNVLSNIAISGTSEISGNFRRGVFSQGAIFSIGNTPIQSMEHDIFIDQGGVVNDILNLNRTSNVVKNVQTTNGLYLNRNFPVPYSFDGTDYILDYIKAPTGEEYNVTVNDTGKLKSEAKPIIPTQLSQLDNDEGFIYSSEVSQSPDGSKIPRRNSFGRMKAAPGTSSDDVVVKSQLDAQAVGRVRVESYTITLDKAQINNLHTGGGVSIDYTTLGLTNTQVVRWRPELTAFKVEPDGTPFTGVNPIQIGLYPIQGVVSIPTTRYGGSNDQIFAGFPVQDSCPVSIEPEFIIETSSEITGGGTSSRIQIKIFFEIDTVTFL